MRLTKRFDHISDSGVGDAQEQGNPRERERERDRDGGTPINSRLLIINNFKEKICINTLI